MRVSGDKGRAHSPQTDKGPCPTDRREGRVVAIEEGFVVVRVPLLVLGGSALGVSGDKGPSDRQEGCGD